MAATNSEYSAFVSENELYVTKHRSSFSQPEILPCPGGSEGKYSSLALSQRSPELLALACSSQVYIVDLKKERCKHSLVGIGRVVTAIAFADDDAGAIAIGHIDGSICIWRPDNSEYSHLRLLPTSTSCNLLAFSPARTDILASASHDRCEIWDLGSSSTKAVLTLNTNGSRCTSLAWCQLNPERLVVSCEDGELRFLYLSNNLRSTTNHVLSNPSGPRNDGLILRTVIEPDDGSRPVTQLSLGVGCDTISWIDDSVLLGLSLAGRECLLLGLSEDGLSLKRTWLCAFKNRAKVADLRSHEGEMSILAISEDGVERHIVPREIHDELNLEMVFLHTGSSLAEGGENSIKSTSHHQQASTELSSAMSPVSISQMRYADSSFARTSRQLQRLREQKSSRSWGSMKKDSTSKGVHVEQSEHPPSVSMTSSLELPGSHTREDVISPMPFLSPGIPARETSSSKTGFFGDSSTLVPIQLPQSSIESTAHDVPLVIPERDSEDSDDESYADDLQGSTTFLPGGINVPLPKACGALFHPNGQLLIFFPPKQQHTTPSAEEAATELRLKRNKGERIIRLFPTFGNMVRNLALTDDESSIDSEDMADEDVDIASQTQAPSTRPTSTIVQPVSNLETLGIPSAHVQELSQSKLVVRVYEIDDFQLLGPSLNSVAQGYRILCKDSEPGAQLCMCNAQIARESGHKEVAQAWWIISKLLEDRVPLLQANSATEGSLNDGFWRVAQQLQLLALDEFSAALLMANQSDSEGFGKLRWANHPLGGAWLIRRVLDWAQSRADVQFLACAAAILSQADAPAPSVKTTAERSMLQHLPTYSLDYFTYASEASRAVTKPATPLLRTHTSSIAASNDSPTKRLPDAPFMSRSSSQLATPALEPNSTPPWSFSLTRQSTNLSATSGSVSSDMNRGSFGVTAPRTQSYAQSISEKAAMLYNWSPTPGRSDGTPSASGALSSSLPTGSWAGKSVSFASITYTDDTRGNSWSSVPRLLAQDDDNDSDKTIEDSSIPHTPKSPIGGVSYELNNMDMFADESSGCAKMRLMPDDLKNASRVWCQYYGDLLRSWDMHLKATELEKAIGLSVGIGAQYTPTELGMQPLFRTGRRKTCCVICDTMASGIVQTCAACLHVSHLQCAEEFLTELGEDGYSCPSGCGCVCSALAYEVQEIVPPQAESPPRPGLRKKASFTDPRRWRARVEGDSW